MQYMMTMAMVSNMDTPVLFDRDRLGISFTQVVGHGQH